MSWVLLGNDDGADSPALLPFASAVEAVLGMPVRVVVPDRERSWSGKSITRRGGVASAWEQRGTRQVVTVTGTPADAVQLGLFELFAEEFAGAPPGLVVTGINLGFNAGSGFLASSGTVWAAAEAAYAGVPAVAVSTGSVDEDWQVWERTATDGSDETARAWERVAATAATVVRDIGDSDLLTHCDLASVNLPWEAGPDRPRRVTGLSTLVYGALFHAADGRRHHAVRDALDLRVDDPGDGEVGDVAALHAGEVSVTPVVLPRSAPVPDRTRAAIEG